MRPPCRILLISLLFAACSDNDTLPIEQLMKPETCETCHPAHFREWSGSMHAYAADDPVFLAMNKRGQEETGGALGDFCVKCHAPMALKLGLTTDGTNLAEVPQWAKGVTCYFCHTTKSVEGTHNNPLVLADDGVMLGGIRDPETTSAHKSAYSELIDADNQKSSAACGACHDIVTPKNVHLERTFQEWTTTIFANENPRQHLSCSECHMVSSSEAVAVGGKVRPAGRREHTFAGVDVALTPWPQMAEQRAAIDRDLKGVLNARLCVLPTNGGEITVRLDNVGAGHMFPSGAAQDRRAWVEVIAYDAANNVLFKSGDVSATQDPEELGLQNVFAMYDEIFKEDQSVAKFFWEVASIRSSLLKPAVTTDINDPRFDHATTKAFPVGAIRTQFAKVTAVVKLRPLPLSTMRALMPWGVTNEHIAALPTFELAGTKLTWTPASAVNLCVE